MHLSASALSSATVRVAAASYAGDLSLDPSVQDASVLRPALTPAVVGHTLDLAHLPPM
jgi:hypothetical protein